LQDKAIHTAAGLASAPSILRSTKLAAGIATLPVAEHDVFFATAEQTSAVSTMLVGLEVVLARKVTVIGPFCWE
jgi:hypothetical protein